MISNLAPRRLNLLTHLRKESIIESIKPTPLHEIIFRIIINEHEKLI